MIATTLADTSAALTGALGAITQFASIAIGIVLLGTLIKMLISGSGTARNIAAAALFAAAALGGLFALPKLFSSAARGGLFASPDPFSSATDTTTSPATPSTAPPSTTTPPSTNAATTSAQYTPDSAPSNTFHPDWAAVAEVLAVLVVIAALVAIAAVAWHLIAKHHTARRDAHQYRQDQITRWEAGQRVFRTVSEQLTEFEMDDEAVHFSRHLLADITEPLTAAFHEAYSKASALNVERPPHLDAAITAFVTAADDAQRAFGAASDNALRKARVGIISAGRQLTSDEQRRLGQARKLLNQALDPASTQEEATTAHTKAYRILDEVGVVVPERLKARTIRSIEALHKSELTASTPGTNGM